MPPVGRQRKPHTSPAQISVLPSPTSTVFTRRCPPLAFTSVSPIVDQRRSRDPPADVPARLRENSGTTLGGKLRHHTRGGGKLRHHTRGGKLRHHTRGKTQAPHPGGTTPRGHHTRADVPARLRENSGTTPGADVPARLRENSGTTLGENSGTTLGHHTRGGKLRHHTRGTTPGWKTQAPHPGATTNVELRSRTALPEAARPRPAEHQAYVVAGDRHDRAVGAQLERVVVALINERSGIALRARSGTGFSR